MGSCFVPQSDLELAILLCLNAETTGVHHHALFLDASFCKFLTY
jgi:hypothetical protein